MSLNFSLVDTRCNPNQFSQLQLNEFNGKQKQLLFKIFLFILVILFKLISIIQEHSIIIFPIHFRSSSQNINNIITKHNANQLKGN